MTTPDRRRGHLLQGSVLLIAAVAINGLGGFAFWWVAAWRGDAVAVGAAQELFAAVSVVICLTSMGLPVAVARYCADDSEPSAEVFRWSLVYTAITSLAGAALLIHVAPDQILRPLRSLGTGGALAVVALLVAGMSFAVLVEVRLMALRRWGWVVGRVALVVGLRLPLLWWTPTDASRWLLLLVAGAPALSGLIGAVVLHRSSPSRGWWRALPRSSPGWFRYSAVNYLGLLGSQGPMFVVPFVVAISVDSASFAPFYVAWAITQTAFLVPHMVGQAFLVEAVKPGADHRHQLRIALSVALGAMLAIAVASLAVGRFVGWSLGDDYHQTAALLPWLLAGCIPWALTSSALARARLRHEGFTVMCITATFFGLTVGAVALGSASDGVAGASRGWLVGNVAAAAMAGATLLAELRSALGTPEAVEPILVPLELEAVVGS
ncbi:MAG: lipopolysaccharide biosynthesis protein [Acidimicrobiales bacterium]